MTTETNTFGGKNPLGEYVPMSEDEQEVVHRLAEDKALILDIDGWGTLRNPKILVGDHRVSILFRITFTFPPDPTPIHYFDLTLKTETGIVLASERLPCLYDNKPITAQAGTHLDLAWDLAIHHMSPALVKAIKPGALGMTSRRQDKDTGDMTAEGNMKLTSEQRRKLHELEKNNAAWRASDKSKREFATVQERQDSKGKKKQHVEVTLSSPAIDSDS